MPKQKNSDVFYLAVILLSCCVAFWPLTFNIFSLKNDALNYFLPVRFAISESIQHGYWPFWSPYFNLGYPLHGDMQSGVWNPFVQIFSLFGVYTIKMLQYETLLYVFISGIGMFYLLKYFITDKRICLFGAISYMLCGYISDSAQFLNWISSASFIPFVFLFYYRSLKEKSFKMSLYSGLFLFLLFTTAYPADFILMCYLLLGLFIVHLINKKHLKPDLLFLFKQNLVFIFAFILFSLPAIISYAQFLPLTERGSGAGFETAMSNPLHPKLLFAYVTPLGVWKAEGVYITDPLERNSFIGLYTFIFLIVSFAARSKQPIELFAKWVFVIFLLFSFGVYGGLRVIAYYVLPLMDSFRHPANAKIFTSFFACILASFVLKRVVSKQLDLINYKLVIHAIVILIVCLIFWVAFYYPLSIFSTEAFGTSTNWSVYLKTFIDQLTFADFIILNIILQLPFLFILYLFYFNKINLTFIIYAGIINSVIHVMLFQPFTVVKKDSVFSTQAILNQVKVEGYPLPDLKNSLKQNSFDGNQYFDEIGVSNLYNKRIGRVDYRITPSNLLSQNKFWFNEKLRNYLFNLPILYRPDTALHTSSIQDSILKSSTLDYIFSEDEKLVNKINALPKYSLPDQYTLLNFTPNGWNLNLKLSQPGYFCFFQNHYPRWAVAIDGKKIDIDRVNTSFIGFFVPAGNHHVSFAYQANDLKAAYLLSVLLIIFTLIVALKQAKTI